MILFRILQVLGIFALTYGMLTKDMSVVVAGLGLSVYAFIALAEYYIECKTTNAPITLDNYFTQYENTDDEESI